MSKSICRKYMLLNYTVGIQLAKYRQKTQILQQIKCKKEGRKEETHRF